MIKYYKSVKDALIKNNFDVMNSYITDYYLISKCIKTNKTYICHIDYSKNGFAIDKCKEVSIDEAIAFMLSILKGDNENKII